jgi:amino acid permease
MTEDLRNLIEEQPSPKKTTSIQAIFSFITGILAYLILFFHSLINMGFILAIILAPISAVIAIFTGHKAKKRIRHSDGTVRGSKIAGIGLFLGYLFIIVTILVLILALIGLGGLIAAIKSLLGG